MPKAKGKSTNAGSTNTHKVPGVKTTRGMKTKSAMHGSNISNKQYNNMHNSGH